MSTHLQGFLLRIIECCGQIVSEQFSQIITNKVGGLVGWLGFMALFFFLKSLVK